MAAATNAHAGQLRSFGPFDNIFIESNTPRPKMPGEFNYRARHIEQPPLLGQSDQHFGGAGTSSGLSFGPVHAESETINGRRHVHYRVDGFTVLGGQIGGSLSRHGAMLTLHWTSSGD